MSDLEPKTQAELELIQLAMVGKMKQLADENEEKSTVGNGMEAMRHVLNLAMVAGIINNDPLPVKFHVSINGEED